MPQSVQSVDPNLAKNNPRNPKKAQQKSDPPHGTASR
jgi:hypothetical protein